MTSSPSLPVNLSVLIDRLSNIGLDDHYPLHSGGETRRSKSNVRHQSLRDQGRAASVFVLISSDLRVLFTLRSKKLKSHPGQVSFPGGKQDKGDEGDDIFTALRETQEEVGLDYRAQWGRINRGRHDDENRNEQNRIQLLCRMPTTEALGRLCVTPVVAVHQERSWEEIHQDLDINYDEVEEAFWTPLSFFCDDSNLSECYEVPDWPVPGESFVYRKYDYKFSDASQVFSITGLTADIIHRIASIVFHHENERTQTTANNRNCCVEGKNDSSLIGTNAVTPPLRGFLKRWVSRPSVSTNKGQWEEFFFILGETPGTEGGGILHQYDSTEQALRKEQSANKKNRMRLIPNTASDGTYTEVIILHDGNKGDSMNEFTISTLGGRVKWQLAASSSEGRDTWVRRIQSIVNSDKP